MTPCPGRDLLVRLLVAAHGDGAGEDLVGHVEVCSDCQQALESMMAEDWGPDLEGWPMLAPVPEPPLESFLRRLQQAPPGGSTRAGNTGTRRGARPPLGPRRGRRASCRGRGERMRPRTTTPRVVPPRRCPGTRSWASWAAAAWGSSTRPGRSGSIDPAP